MKEIIIDNELTRYLISSDGLVFSLVSNRFLSLVEDSKGYFVVTLHIKDKQRTFKVHRLVAIAYIENPNELKCINHLDNNRKNNKIENLEWITSQDNTKYKVLQGRQAKGVANGRSKLTNELVLEIRNVFSNGNISKKKLAKLYNVSDVLIGHIVNRKTWTHI